MRNRCRLSSFLGVIALLLGTAVPAPAAVILNTLEGPDEGRTGWSGRVDGLFSASGGNTDRLLVEAGGRIRWRGASSRVRLQVNGGYEENGGSETSRNVVAHLRHNRDLGRRWATVSFVQVQHNPFQRLRSRWLFGAGPRWDVARDDRGLVAVGATPMLEIERLEDETGHVARGRLSVFVNAGRKLGTGTRLDAVVFWQPLFSEFSASRAVANLTFAVDVTGSVDLKVGAALEHNARAPRGVERTDWSTFTGLGASF